MPRAAAILAAAVLLAAGLSCSDDSNPSSPTTANLAQGATKRGPTLTPQVSGTTARSRSLPR